MIEVFYHKTNNGEKPAKAFIDSLDTQLKAKTLMLVRLLHELGNNLSMPYSKHLEDGIFELRPQKGNNKARVLYFFYIGNKAILTNGFIKKTQKTPRKQIDLAKKYRNEYLKQEGSL